MIHLTSAQHAELLQARAERDQLRLALAAHAGVPQVLSVGMLQLLAETLVQSASASGQVVTITQVSETPLAMGNYTTAISLRAARVRADVETKAPTP